MKRLALLLPLALLGCTPSPAPVAPAAPAPKVVVVPRPAPAPRPIVVVPNQPRPVIVIQPRKPDCPPNRPCPRSVEAVGLPCCSPACTCGCNAGGECPCNPHLQAPRPSPVEPQVDLLQMGAENLPRNISSKGAGCCTFRSAEFAARWQNEPALYGLPEWMRERGIRGGGDPTKQAEMVRAISQARGLPVPGFVQYEGSNPAPVIEAVLKGGRLACVTWLPGHMLTCVHLDAQRCGILDNNGPVRVDWYSRQEGLRRIGQGRGAWVFALTASPPPPRIAPATFEAGVSPDTPGPAESRGVAGGLEWTPPATERFTLSGREVSREQALAALQDGLPDDSALPRLTAVGVDRSRLLADLGPLAAGLRIQVYRGGEWAVSAARGFGPGVVVQDAAGAVLYRRADYDAPELLRRLKGEPDPAPVTPDAPASPAAIPTSDPYDPRAVPPWAYVLVGATGLHLARRRP